MRNEDNADGVEGTEAPDFGDAAATKKKAEAILEKDRATADEIAWAWVTLLDLQAGNDITPREARYRTILFAREWIQALSVSEGSTNATPTRELRGVTVKPLPGSLIEVDAVRKAAQRQGRPWPGVAAELDASPQRSAGLVVNTTAERHDLDHVIEKAIRLIKDRGDVPRKAAIWNELKEMALAGDTPFSGMAENRLEYTDGNGKKAQYQRSTLFRKLSPDRWKGTKI